MDLDPQLDPFWSADPAWARAAWMRERFKGCRSKEKSFFASINRMFRIIPVF